MAPQMVVSFPSRPPLVIACCDVTGRLSLRWVGQSFRRFAWRGGVPVVREPAEFAVSGGDWLTLVEAFGLAPYLEERG